MISLPLLSKCTNLLPKSRCTREGCSALPIPTVSILATPFQGRAMLTKPVSSLCCHTGHLTAARKKCLGTGSFPACSSLLVCFRSLSARGEEGERARKRPHREKGGILMPAPCWARIGEERGADKELGVMEMPQAISQEPSPASLLNRLHGNRIKGSGSMGPHLRLDYLEEN